MKRRTLVRVIFFLLVVAFAYWLIVITTPPQCGVSIEKMSQFCKDFSFPS